MRELGIDSSSFRSRAFTPNRAAACDLIIAMTRAHAALMRSAAPELRERIRTLIPGGDVPDPFGGDAAHYREVFGFMRQYIDQLFTEIE